MCTYTVHIVFGAVLFVSFVLTCISFATPGWSKLYVHNVTTTEDDKKLNADGVSFGLLGKICPKNETATEETIGARCKNAWKSQPGWVKATLAFMILAILTELATMIWSCVAFATPCCKSCVMWPLPVSCAFASICLFLAIIIYAVKMGDIAETTNAPTSMDEMEQKNSVGYSMWMAIFALGGMVVDTALAVVLVKVAKVSPV